MTIDPTLLSLLRFGLVLSLLVFVHELGHFLAAKWRGVAVEEFGFGIPPKLWGRKIGATIYSVNLLPIGGFVKLKGEDPEVAGFGDLDSLAAKTKLSRAAIICAGVVGNLALAYLIFTFLFAVGNPDITAKVLIKDILSDSPAALTNLQKNDVVTRVNEVEVLRIDDLLSATRKNLGREVSLTVEREGQVLTVRITPRKAPPAGQGPMGLVLTSADPKVVLRQYPIYQAPYFAAAEIGKILKLMLEGIGTMLTGIFVRQEVPSEVTGVVGIKALTDVAAGMGLRFFLQFVALLSLNLLIFNLLPIPALDGGRLLFVALEGVTRRKIPPKIETLANNLGLAFLILLFVLVTAKDIGRFW